MEFWGVEVQSGKPLAVTGDFGKMLHLSQATLGESKEENADESVRIFVTVDGKKFALGILSSQNNPQLSFDLVLEKDFELSHNWKNGSVFFLGYKTSGGEYSDEDFTSEDEEPVFSLLRENGKAGAKDKPLQPATAKADTKVEPSNKPKSKAKPIKKEAEPKEDDEDDSSDDDDYSDEDEDMISADDDDSTDGDGSGGSDDDEDGDGDDDDDGDGDESEDGEDEETPKADLSKKRSNESATKTPVPATKKAKFASPQKTDGKKGSHTATPHPKMQAGKTPAAGNKKNQTPKSGGSQFSCSSCKKTFNSDTALQSHTKAKHSAK